MEAVRVSMITTVSIFPILVGAKVFGKAITLYQILQEISQLIVGNSSEPWVLILILCAILLVMGLFLEAQHAPYHGARVACIPWRHRHRSHLVRGP